MEGIKKKEQNKNGKKTYHRFDISDAKWKLIYSQKQSKIYQCSYFDT